MDELQQTLLTKLKHAISESVSSPNVAVAFSGGVDSTLISKVCLDMGYDVTLLTIGFANSHDILFAKEVNRFLKLPHKIFEIQPESFHEISKKIKQKISTSNLSWNENCIAFYYVSKLAKNSEISTVITANGIDELFCGYNAYREAIDRGENEILKMMESKIQNELKMMKAVNEVSSEFDVKILQPLLSNEFIEFARSIPISEKIKNKDDLYRKHIVRKLALSIGVPEISANKRKKALQYGSDIHKSLMKIK